MRTGSAASNTPYCSEVLRLSEDEVARIALSRCGYCALARQSVVTVRLSVAKIAWSLVGALIEIESEPLPCKLSGRSTSIDLQQLATSLYSAQ